jgi:hypothetical protein
MSFAWRGKGLLHLHNGRSGNAAMQQLQLSQGQEVG